MQFGAAQVFLWLDLVSDKTTTTPLCSTLNLGDYGDWFILSVLGGAPSVPSHSRTHLNPDSVCMWPWKTSVYGRFCWPGSSPIFMNILVHSYCSHVISDNISRHQNTDVLSRTSSGFGFFMPFDRSRWALHDGVNSSVTSGKQLEVINV